MWSALQRYPDAFTWLPPEEQQAKTSFDWAKEADSIVEEMDEAAVDASVVILADFSARLGETDVSLETENEYILRAHERHPERLIPFFGIDPRRPDAASQFEAALGRGARGLKLHPSAGFFPHDECCYPLYDLCVEADVPVLFHSGPGFHPRMFSRFSHPFEFDQAAADYPRLRMVLGHAGGDWWEDCLVIARTHPNLYLELSEWQLRLRESPETSSRIIRQMAATVGADRLIWGSDFPHVRRYMSLAESLHVFKLLSGEADDQLGREELDAIVGNNARALLGLDRSPSRMGDI